MNIDNLMPQNLREVVCSLETKSQSAKLNPTIDVKKGIVDKLCGTIRNKFYEIYMLNKQVSYLKSILTDEQKSLIELLAESENDKVAKAILKHG